MRLSSSHAGLRAALVATTMLMMIVVGTEAWTTPPSTTTTRGIFPRSIPTATGPIGRSPATTTTTGLFGKKKKKKGGGGGGGGGSATKGAAKIQVKLLQHIAGTGQAGDVILVNPVFFANKLRPQKLARVITDEEVQADLDAKREQSDELRERATALRDLLDASGGGDGAAAFELVFRDNQTGPDGKKLFGGIGPKKLLDSLRTDCPDFGSFSKQFPKQVSILDIEEEVLVAAEGSASSSSSGESKYKDYSSYNNNNNNDDGEDDEPTLVAKYTSLPKKDKLTIKTTGVFRLKVALTKDLFAKVRVVVE